MTAHSEGWRAVAVEMIAGVREALARFPITALFLLLGALNASLLIHEAGLFSDGRNDFVMPLIGGALGSLAAALFWEPRTRDPWIRHCGSLIAGVFCFGLLWLDTAARTLDWTLMVALGGLVPVAAFLGRGSGGSFWLFSVRFAFASVLALLSLLLFAGGISAVLASLTYLFGLGVPTPLYAHVWVLTGLFAAPLFGLGQVPRDFESEPAIYAGGFAQRGVRALGEFVAAPLLIVYAAILHAYAIKIAITGEVPQGQIGWLVLAYGLSMIGSLVVCRPFMGESRAPTRFFLRIWPFLLPVPLILLFYALYLRIGAYGVTPERYLLGLFGLAVLLLILLQIPRRSRGDIRILAAVPVLMLFLASFGPQGAVSVSTGSQAARFLAIAQAPPFDQKENDEALAALGYLSGRNALALVEPEGFDQSESDVSPYRAIALAWGLDPDRRIRSDERFFSLSFGQETAIAVRSFDLVVPNAGLTVGQKRPTAVVLPDGRSLEIGLEEGALAVAVGERSTRFPIDPARVDAITEGGGGNPPHIILEADGRRIMLVPTFLYGERQPKPQFRNFAGAILLRSEDWE